MKRTHCGTQTASSNSIGSTFQRNGTWVRLLLDSSQTRADTNFVALDLWYREYTTLGQLLVQPITNLDSPHRADAAITEALAY